MKCNKMKISKKELKSLVESVVKEQFDVGGNESKPYKQLAAKVQPLAIRYLEQGDDTVIPALEKAAALAGKTMGKNTRYMNRKDFAAAQIAMRLWFGWAGFSHIDQAPGDMLDNFESAFRGHDNAGIVGEQFSQEDFDSLSPMKTLRKDSPNLHLRYLKQLIETQQDLNSIANRLGGIANGIPDPEFFNIGDEIKGIVQKISQYIKDET
jgi:hypothetical protein